MTEHVGRSFTFNTQNCDNYREKCWQIEKKKRNTIYFLHTHSPAKLATLISFDAFLWNETYTRTNERMNGRRKNERKKEHENIWNELQPAESITTISKGIEEENSNVAIMLMAIQLSFSNSNSTTTLGDMPGYGLYYFFFSQKKGKKSVKTLLAYALSVHTQTQHSQTESESQSKRKCEKRDCLTRAICTYSFILFLEYSFFRTH